VSGEVTLLDTPDGAVSRLVHTASTLFDQPRFGLSALVGGLAVTVRLATVHRATNDVDTVSEGDGPREFALEYLGDAGAAGTDRIEIAGVKVDVMATAPLPDDASELPDGDVDRLFVLGHRWALETAQPVSIQVVAGEAAVTQAELRVATAPALVACKLHAIASRRDASTAKRESDALDLVRLAGDLVRDPAVMAQFAAAPFDLAQLVRTQVDEWLVGGSTRAARLIGLGAVTGDATIEPRDIATIGTMFIERINGVSGEAGIRGT
jgi:Nucleotidyl transferase AbiEii toxin, Type IV TA system